MKQVKGYEALTQLVGQSEAMRALRTLVLQLAPSDRPVLVTGPTGSGKEVFVQALHGVSDRRERPLLDLNCSALPANLIESQLFGHEKGAFTGADERRAGYFTTVGEGTLFLDEIAELPLELQAKLLRVLETRMFRPLGSAQAVPFRGRIVAATHADLARRVAQGLFREDLYYRLNVLEARIPGLDERRDDIPLLVRHFVAQQPRPLEFERPALEALVHRAWQGNVRELRNLIDRIAVLAPPGPITAEILEKCSPPSANLRDASNLEKLVRMVLAGDEPNKLKRLERLLVDEALNLAQGNKTAAARMLGVHRKIVERRVA